MLPARLAPALALAVACAAPRTPSPAPVAPIPPLPRSSIAAVLAHAGELGLAPDEVEALERIDADLQRRLDAIAAARPAQGEGRRHVPAGTPAQAGAGESGAPPSDAPARSPAREALPEGAAGHGHGGGAGHARSARGEPQGEPTSGAARVDAEDTRAFLDAEQRLAPAQRERARAIAEAYREARYDAAHTGESTAR
ncbi:MAG TPA: hypothetical protein VLU43_10930 [Anaeromyxobacteraceae bacterium]|nr:hypothetical protein [Anaeromyxobacteraceae bacterium]